ncbi:MAG: hypothetical protein IPJ23_16490 [Ignavibacteriales bacterium]|nr:hypothetical protein [Ignavibacteriales bacterium]
MKRYLSAILIPCLLLQLFGCYSNKYLSKEELRPNYSYDPIMITTNDGREFIIKKNVTIDKIEKDSTTIYCSDFYWIDDSLILSKNSIELSDQKDGNGNKIKVDKVVLSNDVISKISVSEYNGPENRTVLIVAGVIGLTLFGALIAYAVVTASVSL